MIKAVIFDFDDTLAQTWKQKWAHHKHTAKDSYGVELTDEKLAEHWGEPFNVMVGNLYGHPDTEENMITENRSTEDLFRKPAMPGALEVVSTLKATGIKLGIITSTNTDFVKDDLIRLDFNLDDFFYITGAEHSEFHKPDPRVFDEVLAILAEEEIEKTEIAYVGDSTLDCQAALGAGIHHVAITTGRDTKEELVAAGASIILEDISELPATIKEL